MKIKIQLAEWNINQTEIGVRRVHLLTFDCKPGEQTGLNMKKVLKYSLIGAGTRSVDEGIPGTSSVSSCDDGSAYEKFLESFPELARHSAINGEINWITNYDKKVCE